MCQYRMRSTPMARHSVARADVFRSRVLWSCGASLNGVRKSETWYIAADPPQQQHVS